MDKQLTSEQLQQIIRQKPLNDKLRLIYSAIEHARNGIIITDHQVKDDPIIYCNKAFLKLTGYSKKEVIGQNCRFLQGKERDQKERLLIKNAIKKGEPIHLQIRNYKKNGKMFWNDLLMSPIKDKNGKVTHFSGNQLDITPRKEAEMQIIKEKEKLEERVKLRTLELEETKEYLESIVETVRQPLVVLDGNLKVLSANNYFYKTFKVKKKQTEGQKLYKLGNKQWNIPELRKLLEEILPGKNPFVDFEVEHSFPTIGKRIMLLNARQVELRGSKQERILLAIEDVTEARGATKNLERSQALTEAMINSLNAHIAVLDKKGVIIQVNESWKRFASTNSTSTTEDTYIGQNYLEVLKNSTGDKSDEAPLAYDGIKKVMSGKIPHFSLEYPCFTPTEQLWFLLQVTPLRDTEKCVVVAHIDITERKKAEIRKDDFISMASHELKTPITSMKINVQTLQMYFKKKKDTLASQSMEKVDAQIIKLTRLVNELLDVSRIYAGKLEFKKKVFDFSALVENVLHDVQGIAPAHTLRLKKSRAISVCGDPDRIEQVVINLLTNAIKYSPDKTTIDITLTKEKNQIILSVKDEGIGIPKDHHLHVFDRFYQVNGPKEKTYPGLGMGLYISYQIIKHHDGRMWLESEKGKGSTFYFALPIHKV